MLEETMSAPPSVLAITSLESEFARLAADLAGVGIGACYAGSLQDAVERKNEYPITVVVCDADTVDWEEALAVFQQQEEPSAIVFLTRLADERLWLRMLDAGAFDLLEKPYRAQDLCWVITSALKRPTGRNTLAA
ncbi:MAG: hypothetical protein NTZ98_14730 [Acidobacteria bacterium]|nr:hypothetical protein [Acidobacteriota bacterium]